MHDVRVQLIVFPGEPASDHMTRIVEEVRRANDGAALTVEVSDMGADFTRAYELGVTEAPTVIVSIDGIEFGRLAGTKSRRALLQAVLPALYDDERALSELRRQLDSPGERFPRRTKRRIGKVSEQRRRQLLGDVSLFALLTARELKDLAGVSSEVVFEAGSTVVAAGQPGEAFFVVADGDLEVTTGGAAVRRLGPGDIFGEMALLDGLPRSATVSTISDATLVSIDRSTFRELLMESPSIALALLETLSCRIREHESPSDC